jgi:hypothetical protein
MTWCHPGTCPVLQRKSTGFSSQASRSMCEDMNQGSPEYEANNATHWPMTYHMYWHVNKDLSSSKRHTFSFWLNTDIGNLCHEANGQGRTEIINGRYYISRRPVASDLSHFKIFHLSDRSSNAGRSEITFFFEAMHRSYESVYIWQVFIKPGMIMRQMQPYLRTL